LTKKGPRAITKMHTETLLTTTGVGDPLGLTDSMHGNESEDGHDQNRSKIDGRVLTKERRLRYDRHRFLEVTMSAGRSRQASGSTSRSKGCLHRMNVMSTGVSKPCRVPECEATYT
jgi:hypothetical protein